MESASQYQLECSLIFVVLIGLFIYIVIPIVGSFSSINYVVPSNKEGDSIYLSTLRLLFNSYIKVLDTKRLGTLVCLFISSVFDIYYKRV